MQISAKHAKLSFFIAGAVFTALTVLFFTASILGGAFFAGHELSVAAMAVMSFCLAYFYPHFMENKEIAKQVRGEAAFYTCLCILGYLSIFILLYQFNLLLLTGIQTVWLLAFLSTCTLYTFFAVVTRKKINSVSGY
ncbi:hypothetical protein [Alkalicoccus daliensis]|uniref:Permease n=1 Tax=Alkalicoccus daliensis TaxID=745820 RepID=A0A1H0K139_9BACI|nr:hypothetical protein [Alkalicoccus daliensis]SDO49584.1 hypothetical protein SAMN04488053_11564 [Alkalicoccus daliensis]